MNYTITERQITEFEKYLRQEEKSENTIMKYLHDLRSFYVWNGGGNISKEKVSAWKEYLIKKGFTAVTVNAYLAALHSFFDYMEWIGCRVKYLKIQRQMFRDSSRELTKEEYERLIKSAKEKGNQKIVLIMETICATGIRVSEVKYITVEAVKKGRADIALKGKIRTILIPNKLVKKLKKYAQKQKIASGEIFLTASKKNISRRQIWSEMKKLCKDANVDESKVFPHNLRHLFARAFYKICHNIVQLADVLGHSSIETTRIYLITTGSEHQRHLERLGLIS